MQRRLPGQSKLVARKTFWRIALASDAVPLKCAVVPEERTTN